MLWPSMGRAEITRSKIQRPDRTVTRLASLIGRSINYTFDTFGGNSESLVMRTDNSLMEFHFEESAGYDLPNYGVAVDEVHSLVDRFEDTPEYLTDHR